MSKLISFEGCVGAGKSSLTNYFSYHFKTPKILENYEANPFLKQFYAGADLKLETELSFLLIHFSQIKEMQKQHKNDVIFCDFTIEKDLVYAKMNLNPSELKVFESVYDYVVQEIGLPNAVIYIDLSLNIIQRRIFQRGRQYEMDMDINYFKEYNDRVKDYFEKYSKTQNFFFNVDDLVLDPTDKKLNIIQEKINEVIGKIQV